VASLVWIAYRLLADLSIAGGPRGPMTFDNVYGLGVEDGTRVRGGPEWVRSDFYSIEAVARDAADAETMSGPMLRALLERRFQLKVHIEGEQLPGYALSVAAGGLRMKAAGPGGCEPGPQEPEGPEARRPRTASDVRRGEKPYCGLFSSRVGPNRVWVAGGQTFGDLVRVLGMTLGRV